MMLRRANDRSTRWASPRHEQTDAPRARGEVLFPQSYRGGELGALAAVGFCLLAMRYRGIQGLVGGALGLYALQASCCFVIGVRAGSDRMTLPRPLLNRIPLLVLWRTSVALARLQDVTAAGQALGFDVVVLTTPYGASRPCSHRANSESPFFEAIKSRLPKIRIYRAY